ncbi:MAG: helix-turn-helix transcriptional regulator [Chitinophagaceae bacterium]|nr:helix-turn-helix transcriptional regulator [Chitinophagaceae bacterium]
MDVQRLKLDQLVNLLIQKSGLSMGELAGLIGVSRQTLSNWRSGEFKSWIHGRKAKLIKLYLRIKIGALS